jgi:squalene synthase HpnC
LSPGDTRSADLMRTLAAVAAASQAKMARENFPVALRVLPATVRDDLERVYRFARFVDDVGDDPDALIGKADRTQLLDVVEEELGRVPNASLTPVADLAELTRDGRVPVQPFVDLVAANRQDQVVSTYRSFADLVDYCRLSANPVGRVVLYVAGAATTANIADSDAVCTALQVLEHCQDVREDAQHGRTYLPQDDLDRAGVDRAELTRAPSPPALRAVIGIEVARAREMLARGRPLVRRLSGWGRLAVAGYVAGGLATADALERAGFEVGTRTVRPARTRTARHAVRVLLAAR